MADDGFLSRWSRRKAQVRQGLPVADLAPPLAPALATPAPVATAAPQPHAPSPTPHPPAPAEIPPAPTLAEAAALQPGDEVSRFLGSEVAAEVRHRALKQLFADPHFNVMDGLDIYIDDYGRPDPLPSGMLAQLSQADALGLLGPDTTPDAPPPEPRPARPPQPLAHEATAPAAHEDPDLRLQPHDAAERTGLEPGPERDTGRQP